MAKGQRSRRHRLWFALRVLASAIVGLAVLYMVGMNVLLRTHLLRSFVSYNPDKLLLEYSSAYTVVPWRVHVEGFRLRGRGEHLEWILGIDK